MWIYIHWPRAHKKGEAELLVALTNQPPAPEHRRHGELAGGQHAGRSQRIPPIPLRREAQRPIGCVGGVPITQSGTERAVSPTRRRFRISIPNAQLPNFATRR